jgi:hypothetical protein
VRDVLAKLSSLDLADMPISKPAAGVSSVRHRLPMCGRSMLRRQNRPRMPASCGCAICDGVQTTPFICAFQTPAAHVRSVDSASGAEVIGCVRKKGRRLLAALP